MVYFPNTLEFEDAPASPPRNDDVAVSDAIPPVSLARSKPASPRALKMGSKLSKWITLVLSFWTTVVPTFEVHATVRVCGLPPVAARPPQALAELSIVVVTIELFAKPVTTEPAARFVLPETVQPFNVAEVRRLRPLQVGHLVDQQGAGAVDFQHQMSL